MDEWDLLGVALDGMRYSTMFCVNLRGWILMPYFIENSSSDRGTYVFRAIYMNAGRLEPRHTHAPVYKKH